MNFFLLLLHISLIYSQLPGNEVSLATDLYSYEPFPLLVLVTVDGDIHGVDSQRGANLWKVKGSDYIIRNQYPKDHSPEDPFYLVEPSKSGPLFMAEKGKPLKKLPLTIKQLVEMSPFISSSSIYIGRKKTRILALNALDGKIIERYENHERLPEENLYANNQILYLGETEYILTSFEKSKRSEPKWNVSFIEHFPAHLDFQEYPLEFQHQKKFRISPGIDGSFFLFDQQNQLLWSKKFTAPIIKIFSTFLTKEGLILKHEIPSPVQTLPFADYDPSFYHISSISDNFYLLKSKFYHVQTLPSLSASNIPPQILPEEEICRHSSLFFDSKCFLGRNVYDIEAVDVSDISDDFKDSTLYLIDPPQINFWEKWGKLMVFLISLILVLILLVFYYCKNPWKRPPRIRKRKKNEKERSKFGELELTDQVIGYGSHGTIVYKGTFHGRPVAIKRLLLDFYEVAHHEVQLLIQSDHHPNVIRYFSKEQNDQFLFIALELCVGSLSDVIESINELPSYVDPKPIKKIRSMFDSNTILLQITSGLNHLHQMNIVHRDLKPQNILFSPHKNTFRTVISDFGLCKRLADDQSSFHFTVAHSGGTNGWRAPEAIRAVSQNGTDAYRITKSVDIFSCGLIFYYVLSRGQHPFGDRFSREMNILDDQMNLEFVKHDYPVACDLIERMLSFKPDQRPTSQHVLSHIYFWDTSKKLQFLSDVSDRLDAEDKRTSELLKQFEMRSEIVLGKDGWFRLVDRSFFQNLGKYRKYDSRCLQDLLRAIRNKKNHFQDLPEHVQKMFEPFPHGYFVYFDRKFPKLLITTYNFVNENFILQQDNFLSQYFNDVK